MVKRIVITLIICSLLLIDYAALEAFAQGSEYRVTGETTIITGRAAFSGAPIVEYFIAPDDKMDISVWQNPDLSRNVIVGPDGYISYPLLGRMKVAGLSISQLEEMLREKLAKYIKHPQVSVMMTEFTGNKIIILGEVVDPGIYSYKGTINLIQAIALAKDFTGNARSDSVLLIRGNLTEKVEVMRINMTQVIKKGTIDPVIILQPDDIIYVPQTFVAHITTFFNRLSPILTGVTQSLDMRKRVMDIRGKAER